MSVSALVATVVLGLLRFKHERKLEDARDARVILADGALELSRLKEALSRAQDAFGPALTTGKNWPEDEEGEFRTLDEHIGALDSAQAAVRIRFKSDDPVVASLDQAQATAHAIRSTYYLLDLRVRPQGDQIPDSYQQNMRDALALHRQFDRYRNMFLEAAQKAAGVDLAAH
ncbi:MAG: hypothetical protein QOF85_2303 [Solirubrobacterales bacterium]|nr:hypothetical protein [Solirubrobacterales bacterium]